MCLIVRYQILLSKHNTISRVAASLVPPRYVHGHHAQCIIHPTTFHPTTQPRTPHHLHPRSARSPSSTRCKHPSAA